MRASGSAWCCGERCGRWCGEEVKRQCLGLWVKVWGMVWEGCGGAREEQDKRHVEQGVGSVGRGVERGQATVPGAVGEGMGECGGVWAGRGSNSASGSTWCCGGWCRGASVGGVVERGQAAVHCAAISCEKGSDPILHSPPPYPFTLSWSHNPNPRVGFVEINLATLSLHFYPTHHPLPPPSLSLDSDSRVGCIDTQFPSPPHQPPLPFPSASNIHHRPALLSSHLRFPSGLP